MPNPISVGIDLGTTFSVAAYVNENGQPQVIYNQSQNNAVNIPSVVCYASDTNIVVGEAALSEAEITPEKVIRSAKRFIGEAFTPPAGVPQDETPVKFESKVLAAIKKYVEAQDFEIRNAVITVPAYFDFNKIELTKQAAKIAGIDVLGVINEPMAAAIYYCMNQKPENQKLLVYDLGGGTFDSVIIECRMENEVLNIVTLASDGNHQLGGDDWDRCLMSLLLKLAHEKNSDIPSDVSELEPEDRQMLWQKANEIKANLSDKEEKNTVLKINGTRVTDLLVTREDFKNETEHLLRQTGRKVDCVLEQAKLSEKDIDLVLLVGGSTFMPMVQEYVRERFGADKVKLNAPNLAVAYGAALYASNIVAYGTGEGNTETGTTLGTTPVGGGLTKNKINVIPMASHSIGVCFHEEGQYFVENMIFKGDELPKQVEESAFSSEHDEGFCAFFYNNISAEKNIEVVKNPCATMPDDTYLACDSRVELSYLGSLEFRDERIQAGDLIKVVITAGQDGIFADVTHIKTGVEKRINFENKDTLKPGELITEVADLKGKMIGLN